MEINLKEINKGKAGKVRAGHLSEPWEGTIGETKRIFLFSEGNDIFICSNQSTSLQYTVGT